MTFETLRGLAAIAARFWLYLALLMLAPAMVDFSDEHEGAWVFLRSALMIGFVAIAILLATRGAKPVFNRRFGILAVNMLWITATIACALPFYLSSLNMSLADSVFEAISGLSTTGASVLSGLDQMQRGILLWRALMQWVGGIGIVALGVIFLPYLRVGGMQFFSMESSEQSGKPLAQIATYARWMVYAYLGLSVLCLLAYYAFGMSFFDAVVHMMATVSSGGYSSHDASFAYFTSPWLIWTGTLFMLLAALPFTLYIRAAMDMRVRNWYDPQIIALLGIILTVSLIVSVYIASRNGINIFWAITISTFNVTSIITTTGFSHGDYSTWGPLVVALMFLITFFGGCAGSTSGGLKTYRLVIAGKVINAQLQRMSHPHGVFPLRYGHRALDPEAARAVMVFLCAYLASIALTAVALAACGLEFVTAFTGAVSLINNVGPAFGPIIGPAGNFAPLPDSAKWVSCFAMLLGRLEVMTVLALLTPAFWQR